jgi:hypothetical protein
MTREHYLKTKLLTWLPSAVAGLAAFGAMTLVSREWAAEVGLLVYFPTFILMADGIDLNRLKPGWRVPRPCEPAVDDMRSPLSIA